MIYNAKITSSSIFIERGMITSFINVDYDGYGQAFGGYNLNSSLANWVAKIMSALVVVEWDKLEGMYIRIDVQDSIIVGIGNITENRWFYPKKDM